MRTPLTRLARTFVQAVALAAAPAIAVFAPETSRAEPFRIIVTTTEAPLVPNSVLHLALSEGYFERAGVEVELVPVAQTPMAVTALQTGAGEMANISLEALLGLHAAGETNLRAVGSTDKAIPYIIAARRGIGFESLSDGARFGVGRPNSLDHTMSLLVLRQRGVRIDRVSFLPVGQPEIRARALAQGNIDATTISLGVFTSLPERENLDILVDAASFFAAAPILTKVNVVPLRVLETRRADLEAVLEALTLAARDFAARPESWAEAMARARPDLDPAIFTELAPHYAGSWTVNGGLHPDEAIHAQSWLYQTARFLGEPGIPAAGWADFAPIEAVIARIGPSEAGD